ncbi:DcrB/PsbP domain-containing protein [Pseudomonas sp. S1_A06]
MSLLSKQAAALLLGAIASLVVVSAQAAPAKPAGDAPAQKVSMLGGKFTFTLPKGFTATPLPAGEVAQGTAGATGTMYSNATSRTVVIAAENTIVNGTNVKDDDGAFLDTTMADFAAQRIKALPDAKILSEKSLTQNGTGLGLRQLDTSATQGGGPTLDTTLLGASGTHMAVVQIISRASDKAGHEALVKQIASGK